MPSAGALQSPASFVEPQAAASRTFPSGFLWGAATASYQVEGAVKVDGRGPSIWDTFSHTRGKITNGDNGDIADDFYHRFPADIALMKDLGLRAFRFSVSWSRVFPNPSMSSPGAPNPKGLDFYHRLVDALLGAGIAPYCTLFHWDLPQSLQNQGGWQNRGIAHAFAEYAGFTVKALSDRVQQFMTVNEFNSFIELGYGVGVHAPGLQIGRKALAQAAHNAILAHGLAVQSMRSKAAPGTQIGVADNPNICVPVVETPEHVTAARKAMRLENARFLTAVLDGRYPDLYLDRLAADAPTFTDADMRAIGSPLDFVGLNVYGPLYIRADNSDQGYAVVKNPKSFPAMASSWLTVGPESLYWAPRIVHDLWHPKALYISENGASSDDVLTPDGTVEDTDRTMYLRNYLTQLQRATAEEIPVKGYFCWSFLDNFEWADGFSKRFGIVYVDFRNQKRTLKLSARFYKATIAANAVA